MAISSRQEGQSILEVLVSLTIMFIITAAIFPLLGGQILGVVDEHDRIQAMYLAREAVQAGRAIHSRGFNELVDGTHGLQVSNGEWTLSGNSDEVDKFTRSMTITSPDLVTRKVTSQVFWTNTSGIIESLSFTFTALFTDWLDIEAWGDWSNLTVYGQEDIGPSATPRGLDTDGTYAYIAAAAASSKESLYSFDVTNQATPTLLDSETDLGNLNDVVIYGSYLFVAGEVTDKELMVYDISNPADLQQLLTYDLNTPGIEMIADGQYLYLITGSALDVFDVTTPTSPSLVGSVAISGVAENFDKKGDNIYVATSDDNAEVQIFDVSTPSSPSLLTSIDIAGTEDALSVNIQDEFVAIGTDAKSSGGEILFYNITDLNSITFEGEVEIGSGVTATEFVIPYMFVGSLDSNAEFQVYDVRDLSAPSFISQLNVSQLVQDMTLLNNKIYLALRSQDSLKIIGPVF